MLLPLLAYLQLGNGSMIVLQWFTNLVTAGCVINYIIICITYILIVDNLITEVYILEENYILLRDGQNGWALAVYYLNVLGQRSDVDIRQRHLEDTSALFELSVHVGTISRDNCVSLVELAKSGAFKFHCNRLGNSLEDSAVNSAVDSVVGRLHEQGIVEHIFEGALAD